MPPRATSNTTWAPQQYEATTATAANSPNNYISDTATTTAAAPQQQYVAAAGAYAGMRSRGTPIYVTPPPLLSTCDTSGISSQRHIFHGEPCTKCHTPWQTISHTVYSVTTQTTQ